MSTVQNTPSIVIAEAGEVIIVGPGGIIVSMTPEAAAETSDRLIAGAAEAQGQTARARLQEKERKGLD